MLLWIEDYAFKKYTEEHKEHWDKIADKPHVNKSWGKYYWSWLSKVYSFCIPTGARVLEIGCGQGNLLASLKPSTGVGIDFSNEMIEHARKAHPGLTFISMDAHFLEIEGVFDYIILSDVLNDVWDVQEILSHLRPNCHSETKITCNFFNNLFHFFYWCHHVSILFNNAIFTILINNDSRRCKSTIFIIDRNKFLIVFHVK